MALLSQKDRDQLVSEALDPKKVTLTCGIHHYAYGGRLKPNFKCKQCMMVCFMGLIANTPPEKRKEQMEMLEYSVHELIDLEKKGQLPELLKHPEVYINGKRLGAN